MMRKGDPEITDVKSPQCVLCKLIMTQLERLLIRNVTKQEIESALYRVCDMLPKSDKDSCDKFVAKHGDTIAFLILEAVQPSEICSLMFLCSSDLLNVKDEVFKCSLCEAVYINYADLANRKQRITSEAICEPMTQDYKQPCLDMLKTEFSNVGIYQSLGVDAVSACYELHYCKGAKSHVDLSSGCSLGEQYWCDSVEQAKECGTVAYCMDRGWARDVPTVRRRRQLGKNRCSWGPSYWCSASQNADECNAVAYCTEHGWNRDSSTVRERREQQIFDKVGDENISA